MIFDMTKCSAKGHLRLIDGITKEVVLDQQNAIHFGNLTASIAMALAGDSDGHIRYMTFGNGGTSITSAGEIFYRAPNVTTLRDSSASLYNQTFSKDMLVNDAKNNVSVSLTNANYADILFLATLDFGEPSGQDSIDTAINNDGDFVFDEIGITSYDGNLLTHVIFHPVQKALNRVLEIEYTIRIQMG